MSLLGLLGLPSSWDPLRLPCLLHVPVGSTSDDPEWFFEEVAQDTVMCPLFTEEPVFLRTDVQQEACAVDSSTQGLLHREKPWGHPGAVILKVPPPSLRWPPLLSRADRMGQSHCWASWDGQIMQNGHLCCHAGNHLRALSPRKSTHILKPNTGRSTTATIPAKAPSTSAPGWTPWGLLFHPTPRLGDGGAGGVECAPLLFWS